MSHPKSVKHEKGERYTHLKACIDSRVLDLSMGA